MTVRILIGDALEQLRGLPDGSAHCCVTSPPYFGLRDYGVDGQIGLEPTPDAYVAKLVGVFREVRRVLRDDGTLWLNLGDSYAGSWGNYGGQNRSAGKQRAISAGSRVPNEAWDGRTKFLPPAARGFDGIKPKDLIGIPWRVTFALQADGWYLRQDIIWSKPNPMPESVRDRCTKAHEYVFMLSKSKRYFYDADAIAEPSSTDDNRRPFAPGQVDYRGNGHDRGGGQQRKTDKQRGHSRRHAGFNERWDAMEKAEQCSGTRNRRSVWTIATEPYREAHFAVMPTELARLCILAGCPKGGTVLDPFGGAGTTGLVADRNERNAILIELNPAYADLARQRVADDAGMFAEAAQ